LYSNDLTSLLILAELKEMSKKTSKELPFHERKKFVIVKEQILMNLLKK
jgi:hypothetical protein